VANKTGIQVEGLKEFRNAVRAMDRSFGPELRRALNEAADIVVRDAKASVPVRSGRLASTVRASSTQNQARISMGGAKAPYAGFIEFGGNVGRKDSVKRPYRAGGRYLFPAFERNRDRVMQKAAEAITTVARKAGLT
jgi:hypothetical protein